MSGGWGSVIYESWSGRIKEHIFPIKNVSEYLLPAKRKSNSGTAEILHENFIGLALTSGSAPTYKPNHASITQEPGAGKETWAAGPGPPTSCGIIIKYHRQDS